MASGKVRIHRTHRNRTQLTQFKIMKIYSPRSVYKALNFIPNQSHRSFGLAQQQQKIEYTNDISNQMIMKRKKYYFVGRQNGVAFLCIKQNGTFGLKSFFSSSLLHISNWNRVSVYTE